MATFQDGRAKHDQIVFTGISIAARNHETRTDTKSRIEHYIVRIT